MTARGLISTHLLKLLVATGLGLLAAPAMAESLAVTGAWVRATPPGARTTAAYLTIVNPGPAERLLAAQSPAAQALELHTHRLNGGVQQMVRLAEVPVPAAATVHFEPGGLHVMLLDLAAPLMPGMEVELTLRFATAGAVTIKAPVVDARTAAPPASDSDTP
jgi:periplasmic copper chaperone A